MVRRSLVVLVSILATARVGVADPVRAPSCKDAEPHTAKVRALTQIDWCNAALPGLGKASALRGGRSSLHLYRDISEPHDTIAVSLRGVVYGDLDGDRRKEAAVVLQRTTWIGRTGASSSSTSIDVFTLVDGRPQRVGSVPGDGVVDIVLRRGVIAVTSSTGSPTRTVTRYRLDGDDFVEMPATQ